MDIGGPKRAYRIEPVKDPVPRLETQPQREKKTDDPRAAEKRPAKV